MTLSHVVLTDLKSLNIEKDFVLDRVECHKWSHVANSNELGNKV